MTVTSYGSSGPGQFKKDKDGWPSHLTRPTKSNFLRAAKAVAEHFHKNQTDKVGEPYVQHLFAVWMGVRVLGGSPECEAAAWLHDIWEDQNVSPQKLLEWGFPEKTTKLVRCVSKFTESQTEMIAKIDAMAVELDSKDPHILKAADTLNNMRPDRHAELKDYEQKRHKKKYQPSLAHHLIKIGFITTEDDHKALLAVKPHNSHNGGSYSWDNSKHGSTSYSSKKPEPASYSGYTLIPGDWPVGWPAPIDHREGKYKEDGYVKYILESGDVVEATAEPVLAYARSAWERWKKSHDTWSPAKERRTEDKTPPA